MSSRFATTYRRKIKYWVGMFRIIIFFSLICSMIQCSPVALRANPRNLLFRFTTGQIQHPEGVCSAGTFGGKHVQNSDPSPKTKCADSTRGVQLS
jgi:hypothetical protein